jgi:hypothetical protein
VIFKVRIASVLPSRSMFRRTWILDPRSMFRDLGSKIHVLQSWIQDPKYVTRYSLQNPLVRSDFPCSKFDFLQRLSRFREIRENLLQWLSDFFNGFPISSTAFRFLKRLSNIFSGLPIFLNGFPLSEKSGKIYLWRQIYERLISELCISRSKLQYFRDKIIGG